MTTSTTRTKIRGVLKIAITVALIIAAILLFWQFYPRTAFGHTGPIDTASRPACLIVVNRAQTQWRYATRAGVRSGEIVRKWIPFGLTQARGNCTPATTRQRAQS